MTGLLLACIVTAVHPAPRQDETVFVEEVQDDFLPTIRRHEEGRNWRALFEYAGGFLQRDMPPLVRLPDDPNRWIGADEYLLLRISRLPAEAHRAYRAEYDAPARLALERVREESDRNALERAMNRTFFSTAAEAVADVLAQEACDENRPIDAIRLWDRRLRYGTADGAARCVTAARLANACMQAGDAASLERLRKFVAAEKLDGNLLVGGRSRTLAEYLGDLKPAEDPLPVAGTDPPCMRSDVRLWSYAFGAGRAAGRENRFRLLPAYAEVRGRRYVTFTDGVQVVTVDPASVTSLHPAEGVYWTYPEAERDGGAGAASAYGRTLPEGWLLGATIEGEYSYVTMFGNPAMERDPNARAGVDGPAVIRCFHVPTGRLVWDTGAGALPDEMRRRFDFTDRGFHLSAPLVVRGGRVYAGICAAPGGETESRVLCLDAATGSPLWCAFLASVADGWGLRGSSQTTLAEAMGVIHAQTNLGVAAALEASTGRVLWMTKYSRRALRGTSGENGPAAVRPAGQPVLWKGWVIHLPQDREEWLALDRFTGVPVDPPLVPVADFRWKNATSLVGAAGDVLVVGGSPCAAIDLSRMKMWSLSPTDMARSDRGAIMGSRLYLSSTEASGTDSGDSGCLVVMDMSPGVLKRIEQTTWKEADGGGNVVPAGRYLVAASDTVTIYTDLETLRERFWLSQPSTADQLGYADHLFENLPYVSRAERAKWVEEIVRAYRVFLETAMRDGDSSRRVRGRLFGLFMERAGEGDRAAAVDAYAQARTYAGNGVSWANAVYGQACALEAMERWREAVRAYGDLIQWADEGTACVDSRELPLGEIARRRIHDIAARIPGSGDEIERDAAAALENAAPDSFEALRAVVDRYPNSRAAREAGRRAEEVLVRKGRLIEVPSFLADLRERFGEGTDEAGRRRTLRVLEEIGDTVRLGRPGVAAGSEPDPGALRLQGAMKEVDANGTAPFPLCPAGVIPPSLGAPLELFSRGSVVELWNLETWTRVWSCAHPDPGRDTALVGTAFTRDYALAAAWDDRVVSIDLETGRARWTFRGVREGFRIRDLHSADGRLCVVESPRSRSDVSERCICLNDSTGQVAWAMDAWTETAPAGKGGPRTMALYGACLSDAVVALLQPHSQAPGMLLVMRVEDGEILRRMELQHYPAAACMDDASGMFYTVTGEPAPRSLRGVPVDSARTSEEPLEISLEGLVPPENVPCALVAGGGAKWIAVSLVRGAVGTLFALPAEAGATGFPIPLPEGRALGRSPSVAPAIGEDGVLYVYNIPASALAKGRAYVTAFRLGRGGAELMWDEAAFETGHPLVSGWLLAGRSPAVVLAAEDSGGRDGRALVYDASAEGYIRMDCEGLSAPDGRSGPGRCPVAIRRGRLYVMRREGLEVFGK